MKVYFSAVILWCINVIQGKFLGSKLGVLSSRTKFSAENEKWFRQKLDHFCEQGQIYWEQRYFVNNQFFNGSNKGPIFVMLGGESPADGVWLNSGMWYEWAKRYGASMIVLEHRFYGKSLPTKDASVENLLYLRSQQAISDIAYFISEYSKSNNYSSDNKWILFGGSYAGNLVAWARLKFPQYVHGAISSSAPLMTKVDFTEYYEVVRQSLDTISPGCAEETTKAFKAVQDFLLTDSGVEKLLSKLPICKGFDRNKKNDVTTFLGELTDMIALAVQYNNQIPTDIYVVCRYMNDLNKNVTEPIDRLGNLINNTSPMGDDGKVACVPYNYEQQVKILKETDWHSEAAINGNKQWIFQTCNELGYYQTSETKNSMFSDTIPLEYWLQLCSDVFGDSYSPEDIEMNVLYTNEYYGGTDIQVSNVVFLQGTIDPWHALGMVKHPTDQDPLYLINGTSHCYDIRSARHNDPPSLTEARNKAQLKLDQWLSYKQ